MPLNLLLNKNELAKQTLLGYVIMRERKEQQIKKETHTVTSHCSGQPHRRHCNYGHALVNVIGHDHAAQTGVVAAESNHDLATVLSVTQQS